MLNIQLHVSAIDYKTTFHTFYPLLLEHITKPERQGFLKSLVLALGNDGEKVFASWLPYLEEEDRRKLIAGLFNQNQARLIPLLNGKLQSSRLGKQITIHTGSVHATGDDFVIEMLVNINIPALISEIGNQISLSPLVLVAVKALSRMAMDDVIEARGVQYINRSEVKSEIVRTLKDSLLDRGIAVDVADIDIIHVPGKKEELAGECVPSGILDRDSEEIIVRALAQYLLDNANSLRV